MNKIVLGLFPRLGVSRVLFGLALVVLASNAFAQNTRIFELKDGDRVAFLGDTFFEQAIRYGHIETALSSRWPDRSIVFRNIGWSGDGPEGRARAFFDPIDKGYEDLKMPIGLADPTVVLLAYGSMAAYNGTAGLNEFIDKMNTLIDTIEETDSRIAILSPTPREYNGLQLPNPEAQNRGLSLYVDALRSLAEQRGAFFVDLFNTLETRSRERATGSMPNFVSQARS